MARNCLVDPARLLLVKRRLHPVLFIGSSMRQACMSGEGSSLSGGFYVIKTMNAIIKKKRVFTIEQK